PALGGTVWDLSRQPLGELVEALFARLLEVAVGEDVLPLHAPLREADERLLVVDSAAQAEVEVAGRVDAGQGQDPAGPARSPLGVAGVVLLPLAALVVVVGVQVEDRGGTVRRGRDRLQDGVGADAGVASDR